MVDDDEACDDGNQTDHDGCSASCKLDDDARTPGDDRPGYVLCAVPPAPGITCGPGTLCCLTDGPVCADVEQGCVDRYNVASCDGPEDCANTGFHCELQSHYGSSCTPSEGQITWCHHDADCARLFPWLGDGVCSLAGACDFSAAPPVIWDPGD
jgi:cysteine-rich repeat protein